MREFFRTPIYSRLDLLAIFIITSILQIFIKSF